MRQVTRHEQDELLALLALHENELRARPGVYYVDAGFRLRRGAHTDELVLRAHVVRKESEEALLAFHPDAVVPSTLGGIGVDVLPAVRLLHAQNRHQQFDRVAGGADSGNQLFSDFGTLGLVGQHSGTKEPLALSTYHLWVQGIGHIGDPIAQPSSGGVIGTLLDWDETLDCAVALLNQSRSFDRHRLIDLDLPVTGIVDPLIGTPVIKSGAVTRITRGLIDGVGLPGTDFTIVLDPDNRPDLDQISVSGDSGSVWIDATTGDALGLHFAGEAPGYPERAWAKRMTEIAAKLHFEL